MKKWCILCLLSLYGTTAFAEKVEEWEGRWLSAKVKNQQMQCQGVRWFKEKAVVMRGREGAVYPMADENNQAYLLCLEKGNKNKALWMVLYGEGVKHKYLGENCTATGKQDYLNAWSCTKTTPLKESDFSYDEDEKSIIWHN